MQGENAIFFIIIDIIASRAIVRQMPVIFKDLAYQITLSTLAKKGWVMKPIMLPLVKDDSVWASPVKFTSHHHHNEKADLFSPSLPR